MARLDGARTVSLGSGVRAAWSDRSRGDLRPGGPGPADGPALSLFAARSAEATGTRIGQVAWASQVHGTRVCTVRAGSGPGTPDVDGAVGADPGADPDAGSATGGDVVLRHVGEGDALVSADPGVALCILTADCAPLALASAEGFFGAVHAGWRGLREGVVEAAVEQLQSWGATDVVGSLGPCIHAGCYEFGDDDLASVAGVLGDSVRGRTTAGAPALDVPAGVAAALGRAGARWVDGVDVCTACDGDWFSHRARGDTGRQALMVWSTRGSPA